MCIYKLILTLRKKKANLSEEAISTLAAGLDTGVYYGWTQIGHVGSTVYPMVMSLGWNPYFKNEKKSAVSFTDTKK